MRTIINYLRSCFCRHDWEMIFDTSVNETEQGKVVNIYTMKTYRCKKCGYSKKYKSY